MEFENIKEETMENKILEACRQNDKHLKAKLIQASNQDPRIPAKVFENLYGLVDYDLNFVIDILNHSSNKERMHILKDAQDSKAITELFDEYDRRDLEKLSLEDVVEGKDLDIIWEIKEGSHTDDLSKAYLQRCLLTIAYHLGYHQELESFFNEEKRKYMVLH